MPNDCAQLVKAQADIVKIVGEYVRLRKSGAQNWSGLCPFHSEKTGSFSVHAVKQFYYCFGCGQTGDVFSFLQKLESLSFPEAVKAVAQKSGIPLPKREFASPEEAAENRQRNRLIDLHEQAAAWFEQQLQTPEGATAREYLSGRGLTPEGIARFRIGFAPDSYHALREHLLRGMDAEAVRSGSIHDLLRLSGLFSWKQQEAGAEEAKPTQIYARFRRRIMFPIANEQGRVIAFTARALEAGDKAGPKYLNSPETPLYSKGHVLFNLDKARQPIRQLDFALLVEGQMDCITVSLAGIQNVLATSGTAFTEAHVRLLGRYTRRIIVNFDPDTAGANAAEKSIALLTEEGFEVRVVTLEGGLDPDRYVRERGIAAYTAAVRAARRHSDFLIDRAQKLFSASTPEGKIRALNFLLPYIQKVPELIARDDFARKAAGVFNVEWSSFGQEWVKAATNKERSGRPSQEGDLRQMQAGRLSQTPVAQVALRVSKLEWDLLKVLRDPESIERGPLIAFMQAHPGILSGLSIAELLTKQALAPQEHQSEVLSPEERRILASLDLGSESKRVTPQGSPLQELQRRAIQNEIRLLRKKAIESEAKGNLADFVHSEQKAKNLEKRLREMDGI